MIFGSKKPSKKSAAGASGDGTALAVAEIVRGRRAQERHFGRRELPFGFRRLFVPSLVRDYTVLLMRQRGVLGHERFLVWAGTPAGEDAVVSTVVIPRASEGALHGEIPADVASAMFESLDSRDLVPFAQLHTHPRTAAMSETDRERPIVAIRGFLSVIVPDFAFTTVEPLGWRVYEYEAKLTWRAWQRKEVNERLVIDDSILEVE